MKDHRMPAVVTSTGRRQLSVTLDDARCEALERYRVAHGLRSWGEALRHLLDLASAPTGEAGD